MKSLTCILFTFITALAACTGQHRRVDDVLASADSLVFTAPDSAVRLLDSLTLDCASSAQLDRHALLTAKAREKAGIIVRDDTPDSMLSRSIDALGVAADHFRGRGDSLEVQTLFYRGVLLGYRGDYSEALVSLMEAADRAADTGDNFYRAMSYREQADIYSQFYSIAESYKNAKLAIDHFELAAKPLHALHEKIMADKYLVMLNEPDKALKNLAVIRSDSLLSNKAFLTLYHRVISEALYAADDYHAALTHIDTINMLAGKLNSLELSRKARTLSEIGMPRLARNAIEEAEIQARTKNDTSSIFYSQAKIFARDGQYEKAYQAIVKYNSKQVITTNHLISHPYTTLLYKHFEDQSELNRIQIVHTRKFAWTFVAASVMLVLLIICLIIIFRYKSQRSREQAEMLMSDIELFRKQIETYETRLGSERAPTHVSGAVRHPFLSVVNELCEMSYIYPLNDGGYMSLGKKASRLVETFRKPKFFSDLESFVNATNNNIMLRFREQFSQMSDKKQMAMLLIFAGFSTQFIYVVLRYNSLASVRTIRFRLKAEIEQSSAVDKVEFLSYI